jgi:putative Mg2+ transporter-C (MgtC) family protein
MTDLVVLQRLFLITLIAGAIGYERERHGRAAGFRTHMLVGIGSCLVMLTGIYLMDHLTGQAAVDPTRMAAQVVSGIGFLGAGTILRFQASVRGLTTAASLWAVGGVGLAVGAGFLRGAILAGMIVVVVLFGFSRLERSVRRGWYQTLIVETTATGHGLARIRGLLVDSDIEILGFDIKEGRQPDHVRLEFRVKLLPDQPREEIVSKLLGLERMVEARWA